MARTAYMPYMVFFQDQAQYDFAVSLGPGLTLQIAPDTIAAMFGFGPFPAYPSGDVSLISVGISFTSVWNPGAQLLFPGPTGVFLNAVDLSYFVPAQAGNPASIWPANPDHDTTFIWEAYFILSRGAGVSSSPPPAPNNFPQRRWIGGAEMSLFTEGASVVSAQAFTRDASRTVDGVGYAIRGTQVAGLWTRQVAQFRTGLTTHTSWERFYWRPRRQGSANFGIWQCQCSAGAAAGAWLRWNSTGALRALQQTNFGVITDMGDVIAAPTIGTWYKIDILLKYGDGTANSGKVRILINGVDAFSFSDALNNSMSLNGNHQNSNIGPVIIATTADGEYDIDDWICADLPAHIDPVTLLDIAGQDPPIDFVIGSHVRVHYIDPNTGSSTNWTGNRGVMNQALGGSVAVNNLLTSVTASARMEGITDVPDLATIDSQYPNIGVAAAVIGIVGINAGGTDGQLGYRLVAGADVLTTINQLNVLFSQSVAYLPSGVPVPAEISPFHVIHTKSADANLDTTRATQAICEYIGAWGPEDDAGFDPLGSRFFTHNGPYANTPWGFLGGPPASPVYIVAKTYAGNSLYQEITLPAPAHFVHIRPTVGSLNGGIKWFSGVLLAHLGGTAQLLSNFRIWTDLAGNCKFSVSGSDIEVNQTGTTYQVIAFCDPGMRFCVTGAMGHGSSATIPFANPLIDSGFTPELAMAVAGEQLDTATGTASLSVKGPGHPGTRAVLAIGNLNLDWGTLSLGAINSRANLQLGTGCAAYIAWRTTEPTCAGVMVQIASYVGNATNPRTINLTPVSGRVPLAVMVAPDNASACFWRDPSHAGANSANWATGANSTLAITNVGVDTIQINSALNTNLVNYSVWALPGDTAGVPQGEYTNLYCEPASSVWSTPALYVPGPNIIGDGGFVFAGTSPLTLLKDVSGIYTLIGGKRSDTLMDRQTGQTSVDMPIPDPSFKTGYVGG